MMTTPQSDTAQIRKTLNLAFDDTTLDAFCFDYFRKVFDRFSRGMRKDEKITLLLDYCRRQPTGFETLLDNVRQEYGPKATSGKTSRFENEQLKPLIDALEAYLKPSLQIAGGAKDESGNGIHDEDTIKKELPWALDTKYVIIVLFLAIFFLAIFFLVIILINRNPEADIIPPSTILPTVATLSPTIPEPTIPPITYPPSISEKDGMTLLYVPEGDFEMGAADDDSAAKDHEKPRHTVYLSAYWIDQTEVTNKMFGRFVEETGYQTDAEKEGWAFVYANGDWHKTDGANWQHPQGPESDLNALETHPVVQMSWNDAKAYCEWAGRRLPSEAEWEKAARGTDGRKYPWGKQAPTGELANFCDSNCPLPSKNELVDDGYALTAPVGSYPDGASFYGALDMAGNVWEWVNDWYDKDFYAQSPRRNPKGPLASGKFRILRGGSWNRIASILRVSVRGKDPASDSNSYGGFRCAVSDK